MMLDESIDHLVGTNAVTMVDIYYYTSNNFKRRKRNNRVVVVVNHGHQPMRCVQIMRW